MTAAKQVKLEKFSFASSIKEDVWHPKQDARAYEWWYFDALSDDGKDALVVVFLDNFIFSPRYNDFCRKHKKETFAQSRKDAKSDAETKGRGDKGKEVEPQIHADTRRLKDELRSTNYKLRENNSHSEIRIPQSNVPAIAFIYYRNGKPLYRAVNEFPSDAFSADRDLPSCELGENSFKFESASYGSGYVLSINAKLSQRRSLEAKLEWLSIESDFLPHKDFGDLRDKHSWNLVASRSDVTGSIKVSDENKKVLDVRHFRGTGYHDHNTDARWMPETIKDWQWGRAHFPDATAVYYRYRELASNEPITKLFLIKDNELKVFDADYKEQKTRRSIFGIKFPKKFTFSTKDGIELNINQTKLVDGSFFYLRFLSEAKLKYPNSDAQKAFAITEHLAPKALKYRWLDWLVNMRIGRKG